MACNSDKDRTEQCNSCTTLQLGGWWPKWLCIVILCGLVLRCVDSMHIPLPRALPLDDDYFLGHDTVKRQYMGIRKMCVLHPRNCETNMKTKRFSLNLRLEEDAEDPDSEFSPLRPQQRPPNPFLLRLPRLNAREDIEEEDDEDSYPAYNLDSFREK